MLVRRGVVNDRVELAEHAAVLAFEGGWAEPVHYNTIADMQGSMVLAATVDAADAELAKYVRDVVGGVLKATVRTYQETGRFSVTPEQLRVLQRFVAMHRDFWLRKPVALYAQACAKMVEIQEQVRRTGKESS